MTASLPGSPPALLVGRERELALLRNHLTAALNGRGSLVLIGGEAGIGKTALAEALCREAGEKGALVLVGRCYDLTETPPYGPWIDLFAHYRSSGDLPPPPAPFAERGTVGAISSQAALFNAVLDFLGAASLHHPLVVLLEDAHWQDAASLDLLRFLAREVATLPVLLLVTYRVDELTRRHPLYPLLPQFAREAAATRIDLRPLDHTALRTLVHDRYPLPDADTDRLIAFVQARAEGNAFFTGEVLRSLVEFGALRQDGEGWHLGDLRQAAVPPLLRQVIDTRVTRLDAEGQRLLALAAVIGQEAALAVLGPLAEMDEDALLAGIEAATEAHLLVETPEGLHIRFAHALIREAVYAGISPARRRLLHRRIAELLATQAHPDPDAVAMHFQGASDPRAVAWLVKAGERAHLALAWLTAIERYEAALALLDGSDGDLGERGWLRYHLGRLRRNIAPQQGVEYLDEALRIASIVGDRALAAAARFSRGRCLVFAIDYEAGLREMAAGCDALEALPPEEQERLDLGPDADGLPTITTPRGQLVVALTVAGRLAEAIAMGEGMREGVPRHTAMGELGWAHYGDRHSGLGTAYALVGRPTEAREAFARGRERNRAVGDSGTPAASMIAELLYLSLPYRTDTLSEHRRLVVEAMERWEQWSSMSRQSVSIANLSILALTGQWTEARREAEAAMRAGIAPLWRDYGPPILGELARQQGEREEAWGHIDAALPSGVQTAPGGMNLLPGLALLRLGARLHLDAGDMPEAHTWLLAHDHWLTWSGAVLGQSEGQALWAQYYRQAGDLDAAYAHAERALTHATEPRQPLALLAAHRLLGELDTEAGEFADAATHLAAARSLAEGCHAPYERALTLLATAALQVVTSDTDAARVLLDEVRAMCEPLGAKPTLARADALAARLDAAPPTIPVYPAGLSAREIEVLRLVAQGLTNPQVAERLYLSPRTVEQHLRSIYNKLDVSTRAAATAFAVSHGLA